MAGGVSLVRACCCGVAPGLCACCAGGVPLGIRWVSVRYPLGIRRVSVGSPVAFLSHYGRVAVVARSLCTGLLALCMRILLAFRPLFPLSIAFATQWLFAGTVHFRRTEQPGEAEYCV